MKLYRRKDDGRIVGTQAETNGKGNREELDVPTDKAGLIEWLNENLTPAPELRQALGRIHREAPVHVHQVDHSGKTAGGFLANVRPNEDLRDFERWLYIQPDPPEGYKAGVAIKDLIVAWRAYQKELANDVF